MSRFVSEKQIISETRKLFLFGLEIPESGWIDILYAEVREINGSHFLFFLTKNNAMEEE